VNEELGTLEADFDDEMMELYRRPLRMKPAYNAREFHRMLLEHRGRETAKRLLANPNLQVAFTEFYLRWQQNGLKLTVEYLVLQEPWRRLFDDQELGVARQRLIDHQMPISAIPGG